MILFYRCTSIICSLVLLAVITGCGESTEIPKTTATPGTTAEVSGIVYRDENNDGVYEAESDILIPGAVVNAYRGAELIARDTTDENGRYMLSIPKKNDVALNVALLSDKKCYDPESKMWGYWNTIEGHMDGVGLSVDVANICVKYRMLNYGPDDFSWELWHEGPVLGKHNVVLVHGAQISIIPLILEIGNGKERGVPDFEFKNLSRLLQRKEHGQFNVWEFEYADVESFGRYWTHGNIPEYGNRLGAAVKFVRDLSEDDTSVVAHSMGGLVSRYTAQYLGGIDKLLTLATGHFGFEYTWISTALFDYPCVTQMEPGSEFLWDLNSDFQHGYFQLASIAASEDEPSVGSLEGMVRYSSASMVQCQGDGNVTYDPDNTYFTVVPGKHGSIKEIDIQYEDQNRNDDFVFEGIQIFLQSGISDELNEWSEYMYPGELNTRPYFSFRFKEPTPDGYPKIWVDGRRIYSFNMYTTEGQRLIWNFSAGTGEEGQVTVDYAGEKLVYGRITRGQSTIMKDIIDN